jgi:hypothetical protein
MPDTPQTESQILERAKERTRRFGLLDEYATPKELKAEGFPGEHQLRVWRKGGVGPPYLELPKGVLYHIPSAREWLRSRIKNPVRADAPQRLRRGRK